MICRNLYLNSLESSKQMNTILLTGGCGFIGSFFCEKLAAEHPDATIVVLDAMYNCASVKNLDSLKENKNIKIFKGELQNKDLVSSLFRQFEFDTVAHFAAQTHVDNSYYNPLQFTFDNVVGIHTLLETIREYGKVKRFLHISTDEVYGSTSDHEPNTVESLLEPSNPYAATKAAAEMLLKSYIHSFHLNGFIVRMNNVYGPRQYPEKMVPKFLLSVKGGKSINIQGTGLQRRSMLYIDDAINAIYLLLQKGENKKIYNIPSNDEFTVLEVAEAVKKITESEPEIKFIEDRPFNDKRYWLHDSVLKNLGWEQKVSFEDGLKRTMDWYYSIQPETYWAAFKHL